MPSEVAPSMNITLPVIVPAVWEVTAAVNVTDVPNVEGFKEEVTAVAVAAAAAGLTVWLSADEVLPVKFASPPYTAVIEWAPAVRAEVARVALPLASVPMPSEVAPSMNVTLPVIVPAVCEVTAAVNVTDAPNVEGFKEEVTAVAVATVAAALTVCNTPEEVLGAKFASPLYWKLIE